MRACLLAAWHQARHELRLVFIALQFLTRLPVPRWVGFKPAWLNQSARHFPLVGFGVGGVSAVVLWAASALWPHAVAVLLAMAASLWLTGFFHEDGLADTFDALGGAVSRERALVIMKDSRIGTYGAVALMLVLGLKAAALMAMPLVHGMAALLLAHTASRAAAVVLMGRLPYAGDVAQAKAKPMAQHISRGGLVVALGWVALVALGLMAVAVALEMLGGLAWAWASPLRLGALLAPLKGAVPCIALSLLAGAGCTLLCARWYQRRLGGITGDTLGATQQLTELAMLLAWLAALGPAAQ